MSHPMEIQNVLLKLCSGLPKILSELGEPRKPDPGIPHAPKRKPNLSKDEQELCIKNALRYFKPELHPQLKSEFKQELDDYGHIYMYRLMPNIPLKAYPIDWFPGRCVQAKAIMMMIFNNLDPAVAQFPQELVTYGGNGQVFGNWAQFRLALYYLAKMSNNQTMVLYSGHPMGLFPSLPSSPRAVITNGMMIPNYSKNEDYEKLFAMGVTMYGQMTAGSYCYIGPQGIVHGTTITLKTAGRKYLQKSNLGGTVYVTSGLGGMSGAQAKAAVISGCVAVVAEIALDAVLKRYNQKWLSEWYDNLDKVLARVKEAKRNKESVSIGYHGNVVDLWEKFVGEFMATGEITVELGSDQTSLHNPYNGGYYPVGLTYDESRLMMANDPIQFREKVHESLRRQVSAINFLAANANLRFWDYGNAFLLQSSRAGADIFDKQNPTKFRYPSYVEDIMGDVFSLGFGPFRWVCCSGRDEDLKITDELATEIFTKFSEDYKLSEETRQQYKDNLDWIIKAPNNCLVVGSKARILYSDLIGRQKLAQAFNLAIKEGKISAPVVLSRDHHDVSGTDSPYRETANIADGSKFCADMAIQNVIGDSFRGATWVSIHNGGGVGWGEVINGGFGLVLDGSDEANERATLMLQWDVANGVARRAWSGHRLAQEAIGAAVKCFPDLELTPCYMEDN